MSGPLVVGYDGSAAADAALDEAVSLAGALGADGVLCFSRRYRPVGGEVGDLADAVEERGHAVLAAGIERAAAAGVTATGELVEAHRASDGLIALAQERDARMVLIGSHGEGPLRGALLGSTPYRLVQQCLRPVLVVRPPDT